jgi:hypothetical protein
MDPGTLVRKVREVGSSAQSLRWNLVCHEKIESADRDTLTERRERSKYSSKATHESLLNLAIFRTPILYEISLILQIFDVLLPEEEDHHPSVH